MCSSVWSSASTYCGAPTYTDVLVFTSAADPQDKSYINLAMKGLINNNGLKFSMTNIN
jgi:hypothetical protein